MASTNLADRIAVRDRVAAATALTVFANPNLPAAAPAGAFVTVRLRTGREVVSARSVDAMNTVSYGWVEIRVWVPRGTGFDVAEGERQAIQDQFVRAADNDFSYDGFSLHEPDEEGEGDELTRAYPGHVSLGLNCYLQSIKARQQAA